VSQLEKLTSKFPFLEKVLKLPMPALIGGAAAIIAVVVVSIIWLGTPNYKVLFSNISDQDGGAIISELVKMNVPYQLSDNGRAILVPADSVHQTRMMLAEKGLPNSGNVGFELMKETQFGASQFAEQVTYQRAVEGELAQSIQSLYSVQAARVHLAIPKETLFVRDQKPPTASVLLTLAPGRTLSDGQVNAIAWLVASSVPGLTVENVSIVDQAGRLLSNKTDFDNHLGLTDTQMKYAQELESRTIARVMSILTPIVGPGNVHAEVNIDIDFDQREETSEIYRPNQSPDRAAVRSEQINESFQQGVLPAAGVPGALSNEPPAPPSAPIANPIAGKNTGTSGKEESEEYKGPSSSQKNATINYEVDRTISHVKQSTGKVRKISVAVLVNYRTDEEGELVELDEQTIEKIRSLTERAIGFSADRGDTISVANVPFNSSTIKIPVWKDPVYLELAERILQYLAILLVLSLFWFKLAKPLLTRYGINIKRTEDTASPAAKEPDMNERMDAKELAVEAMKLSERYELAITEAREVARNDPRAAAFVLREWMKKDKEVR